MNKLLPRDISKEKVRVDLWLKEIDPINDQRSGSAIILEGGESSRKILQGAK